MGFLGQLIRNKTFTFEIENILKEDLKFHVNYLEYQLTKIFSLCFAFCLKI